MAYAISRKHFLRLAAGFGATVTLGCGGDDSADDGADGDTAAPATGTDGADDADDGLLTDDGVDDGVDTSADGVTTDDGGNTTDDGGNTTDDGGNTTDDGNDSTDDGMDSSSGDGESSGGAVDCSADPGVDIGANHGHALVVSAAEVAAGVEVVYDITGGAQHPHTVTLSAMDFTTLAMTGTVMVVSSDAGHTHPVTVTCR